MFKKIFEELCEKSGESPTAACVAIGIAPATYSCWTENSIPKIKTLIKAAEHFGVTVEYLKGEGKEATANKKKKPILAPVYGTIRCGIPQEAVQDIIDTEELDPDQFDPGEYIGLVAKGNSMFPSILSGDVMIIKVQDFANDGDLAAVYVNGNEATCKRIRKDRDGVTLIPENKSFEEMHYNYEQIENLPVRILGKVCEIRRKMK